MPFATAMMISIGDRRSQVRHFPWASAALAACCVLAYGLSSYALREREQALELALLQVHALLAANPQLAPGAAADDWVALCRSRAAAHRSELPPAARPLEHGAQHELDARCGEVSAAWAMHPLLHWGLIPARPSAHAWFSYAFMHGSAVHLAGNLLLLLLAGSALETLGGRALFIGLYASAIAAAALGFRALHPQLEIPLVGASGAISALMGALAVRCWDHRTAFLHVYWSDGERTARLHARAGVLFPLWLASELCSAFVPSTAPAAERSVMIAHGAHLAGFVYGLCAALVVRASGGERAARTRAVASARAQLLQRRAQAEAVRAERALDLERAFERLHSAARSTPPAARGALAAWRDTVSALGALARRCGRTAEVQDVLTARLARAVGDGDWDEALLDLSDLAEQLPQLQLGAGTWMGLASGLLSAGRLADARGVAHLALGRPEHAPFPPERGLDLARLAQRQSAPLALFIARLTLAQPAVTVEIRAALEALCRECSAAAGAREPSS
jgi:membrane associated rhomboid family serine protease